MGDEGGPGDYLPDLHEKAAPNLRYVSDRGSDSALSFPPRNLIRNARAAAAGLCFVLLGTSAFAINSATSVFSRDATPASGSYSLQLFVYAITIGIFLVVGGLSAYAVIKFAPGREMTSRNRCRSSAATRSSCRGRLFPS